MKQTFTKKIATFFFGHTVSCLYFGLKAQLGTSNYKDQYTSMCISVGSQD